MSILWFLLYFLLFRFHLWMKVIIFYLLFYSCNFLKRPKILRQRKFCSLFNRKICVASLAQLLPSLYSALIGDSAQKSLLLKKLNGSVSNQFATCSACGTRLLRKLKHPRLLLQVPFYFKFSPVFWKSRFTQIRTLGKLLWTTAMLPKVLKYKIINRIFFYN